MYTFNFHAKCTDQTAFYISDTGYSIASLSPKKTLLLHEYREFTPQTAPTMAATLAADAERLGLIGQKCRLILDPKQYQLVMMDAVDVPEAEMAKALRWRLKGLIEYPLNDIAIDAFLVPPHGMAKQQKKAFVAVTPLSKLEAMLAMFEHAYIDITDVSITELALKAICHLIPSPKEAPLIVISLEAAHCQLCISYQNQLYLVRTLQLPATLTRNNPAHEQNTLLEIQRSIDYCLSELKIPEPQQILFTPGFHEATDLLTFLQNEQTKPVHLIDLNNLITLHEPMDPARQQQLLYSIGGALIALENEKAALIDATPNQDAFA